MTLPRLPLIEDLTKGSIPPGCILVEYDPASLWYNASITMTAGWLKTGGRVDYNTMTQPPDDIRAQIRRLGLEPEVLEREEKLTITDWYTATLGQKSKEKYSHQSLKIADLSIDLAQTHMKGQSRPDMLILGDDESTLARFNDEKNWIEGELTRMIPGYKLRKAIGLAVFMRGVHSEWAYKMLEGSCDALIDFRLEEVADKVGEVAATIMRIRSMRNVGFDARWHRLKIGEDFEVTVEK